MATAMAEAVAVAMATAMAVAMAVIQTNHLAPPHGLRITSGGGDCATDSEAVRSV